MARAYHLDPHAPRVVNMRRDHPNGATRRAGNVLVPELGRQVFNEVRRHAVAGAPRGDQGLGIVWIFRHGRLVNQ